MTFPILSPHPKKLKYRLKGKFQSTGVGCASHKFAKAMDINKQGMHFFCITPERQPKKSDFISCLWDIDTFEEANTNLVFTWQF